MDVIKCDDGIERRFKGLSVPQGMDCSTSITCQECGECISTHSEFTHETAKEHTC